MTISQDERNDRIRKLVELASQRQGLLSYQDLNTAFPAQSISAEMFDRILILLRGMDIEINRHGFRTTAPSTRPGQP